MLRSKRFAPLQLTIIYALLATGWIVLSDLAMAWWQGESVTHVGPNMVKGLLFVLVSSAVLYSLVTLLTRRAIAAEAARLEVERVTTDALRRANQLYDTLARANEAALGAVSREQLTQDICRILVEQAEMRLAWIGWVDEKTRMVVIEAAYGPALAYAEGLVISVDVRRPESRGPSGRAIVEERCVACADIGTDSIMAPWSERAAQHGLRSSAAVPLRLANGTRGTLTIYSGRPGYFTPEIVDLVQKLAADLAHGLEVLAVRHRMEQQAEALRLSEQRWQFALDGADEGVWDWNVQTGQVFFSDRLQTMLGYAPGEFLPQVDEWSRRVHPDDLERTQRELADYFAGHTSRYVSEHRMRCKDGTYRWIRDRGKIIERDAHGKPLRMIGTHSDVTERKQAEEALRASEALTRATFEQAAVGIAHVGLDFRVMRANRRLCDILGYAPEELQRLEFKELTWPEDLEISLHHAQRALRGECDSYALEKRYRRKDGKPVPVHLSVSLVRDEFDAPRHFIAVMHDLSRRKEAEQARLELLERLTRISDHIPGVFYQFRLRADGTSHFPYASAGIRDIYGVTPEDVLHDATSVYRVLHPDDRDRVTASILESARTLAPWSEIYRVNHPGGRTLWVQGQSTPQRLEDGSVLWHGYIHDISDRQQNDARMALLDTALQAMPAGIVITDRDGRIEWVNRGFTQLTGYEAGEALGGNPRLLKSGRHAEPFYENLWQTILRGEVWSGELINRRKDGTEYHERMIVAPVSHERAGISHFIAIKQDITEQKTMERQLLRSQRMEGIGLLAGGIAHDLNNVLAPILLSVELLRLRNHDPLDLRTLEVVESSARRGTGIVRQVLTFARGIDGERTPLRPRDLIRELVLILEETFPRDIDIRRQIADDTPSVLGDTTQLHQVLLNLAVNARDAMPQGGTLTFHARPVELTTRQRGFAGEIAPGRYVLMAVQDTGVGMSPEVREHLFEPFFTTKPRGKGTGLGLPTVLGIVRSHGGSIDVVSAPGAGSEFRVYLPALPPERAESTPPMETPVVNGAGRGVLVCDDESAIREIANVVLRQSGFNVIEAGNGREAVELFAARQSEVQVVLMDIMMPIMTGDRAAAEMLQRQPGLPILFMSGLMDQDALQAAMRQIGRQSAVLLKKPFTAQELLTALARILPPAGG